jgi:hypothetical protein
MRLRSILFSTAVACSGTTPIPAGPPTTVAVPLTAATAQLALAQTSHADLVPPWSLTASDGSGLALVRVEAKAVFEGPLAFTELHLYFHNAEARRREGTFQITLPHHAAVSRFAMENEGKMMEAEVVEKQLARRAYDDFLHRKQDPALLEKAPGNQFTAKVFPIAPNADKHLVISYSQELPGAQYVLPLRGLPKVGRVDVALSIAGADGKRTTQRLAEHDWTPDRDFVSNVTGVPAAIGSGALVAAQVSVMGTEVKPQPIGPVTLLVDTSASRGLGYAKYVHEVRELADKLDAPLDVVAFDQDHEAIFHGAAKDFGDAEEKKLLERGAAGASDMGQALASLHDPHRVVVVTDGVITAGAEHADLATAVAHTKADRLDVVLAGGIRDADAAGAIVHAGLAHAGAVLDLEEGAGTIASALGQPVMTDIPVDVAGATWVYPRTIATARPGQSTMIYARLAKPARALDVSLGGHRTSLAMFAGTAPLVERAIGGAEIDELEAKLATAKPDDAKALRTDIAKRSVATRVVSSQTSLLVLESDSDYARYGIDRKALADILAIRDGAIERQHREAPVLLAQPDHIADVTRQKNKDEKKLAIESKPEPAAIAGKADKNFDFDVTKEETIGGEAAGSAVAQQGLEIDGRRADTAPAGPVTMMPPPAPPPPPPVADPAPARTREVEATRRADLERSGAVAHSELADDNNSREAWPPKGAPAALTGELAEIEHALAAHDVDRALAKARDWHAREPGDVLALIGLGDALEAKGSAVTAARIYGSIIDLYPGRADLRRFAAERLARVTGALPGAQALVVDTLKRAVEDRPDHLTGHRLLAYALVRAGKPADAFAEILAAIDHPYRTDSYAGAQRVLAEDAGMIGASYIAAEPKQRASVIAELAKRQLKLASEPSTRFILYWETDGNDVDFHIQDAHHGHAFYAHKELASGGELYADITTGYGPECFAIPGTPKAGPYKLSINYYSQGPMGYGMGLLEVQRFDGKGKLTFEDRPYVIMTNQAYVDLGTFR